MKKLFLSFLLITLSLPAWAGDTKESAFDRVMRTGVIRCGYFTWPPYLMKDPNTQEMSGINYDFMEEIGKTLGLRIEWTEETAAGTAIEGLNNGRYDAVCTSLWPDAARLKNSYLTTPTFFSAAYAVARADDKRFDNGKKSINSNDVTLPTIDGDYTYSLAVNNFSKAKTLALPQNSDGSLLMMSVVTKKADVVFIDKGTMADFNKANKNSLRIVSGLPPLKIFGETLAVEKNEVQLGLLLDRAIKIIIDDGIAQRIIQKYPSYGYFVPQNGYVRPD